MENPVKHLEDGDFKLLGGGLTAVLALTLIVQFSRLELNSYFYLLDLIPALLVFTGIYYSLKTQEFLGGSIGRSISLIATGLSIYGLTFHLVNIPYQELGYPVIYGLGSPFWLASTHALMIFGVSISAYGFYSIWRSSR